MIVSNKITHFIIDQGNSITKLASFAGRDFIDLKRFSDNQKEELFHFITQFPDRDIFISTVRNSYDFFNSLQTPERRLIFFDRSAAYPLETNYKTEDTLGLDRIANAIGAVALFGKSNLLIIDCGTCITVTFLKEGILEGGSISPGLKMRFKSLNHFTGRLPHISFENQLPSLLGKSTKESIESGVVWGLIYEIRGIIESYCSDYEDLSVVLTGGDGGFLGSYLKSPIFAVENLTTLGLNQIYLFNHSEKIN